MTLDTQHLADGLNAQLDDENHEMVHAQISQVFAFFSTRAEPLLDNVLGHGLQKVAASSQPVVGLSLLVVGLARALRLSQRKLEGERVSMAAVRHVLKHNAEAARGIDDNNHALLSLLEDVPNEKCNSVDTIAAWDWKVYLKALKMAGGEAMHEAEQALRARVAKGGWK